MLLPNSQSRPKFRIGEPHRIWRTRTSLLFIDQLHARHHGREYTSTETSKQQKEEEDKPPMVTG